MAFSRKCRYSSKYALILLWSLLAAIPALYAQSSDPQIFRQGTRYIELNIHSLDKFTKRAARAQERLLRKLARKERQYASQLKRKDSAAYVRYQSNETISYDSIRSLLRPDSAVLAGRFSHTAQTSVDSLKGVAQFLQSKATGLQGLSGASDALSASNASNASGKLAQYNEQLKELGGKLSYQSYIDGLISSRTGSLQNLSTGGSSFPALNSIQKEVYYAKSKIAAFRQMADDPSKLEEKALEYLEGQEGFDGQMAKALNGDNPLYTAAAGNGSSGSAAGGALTASDLEKMGYQTKRQVSAALQKQFGSNLSAMQAQVGSQVSAWQDKVKGINAGVKDAKEGLNNIRNIGKPSFKINPMRGLPFWQRIEKGYSFNTQSAQGVNPAILNLAATAGFRYSPSLSIGLGIATDIGLGQSFSAIHFSFQGAGVRSYLAWQMAWGIGAYGGYERMYKRAFFNSKGSEAHATIYATIHNTADYNESALLGLTKSYHINSKYNGAIQVLYDMWWKEKATASPFILRFTTKTK